MTKKRKKRVYTAGTWDCLHIGHINILKEAKKCGDELIVSVSTDELVNEYKKHTPIMPFEERFEIIKSLRFVDYVIAQTDRDKIKALDSINFDVWVIGNDWYGNDYYMDISKRFEELGVETVWIPYTKGISSSQLRENPRVTKNYKDKEEI